MLLKFSGYVVTGGIAAVFDAGGFALLHQAGTPIALAAVVSFLVAAVVNFQLSSNFVFMQAPSRRSFALFLSMATLGLIINAGLTVAISNTVGLPPEIAKILAIGATFVVNFLLNYFVVFRAGSLTETGRGCDPAIGRDAPDHQQGQ
jgi:putative flippase GtrA